MKTRVTPVLWTLLFVLMVGASAYAQGLNPRQTMLIANRLYENGRYAEAALVYEQLIAAGNGDAAVYHNLGNSYFQQQAWGRAIVNYNRAARLAPRDPAIRHNLDLARARRIDSDVGSSAHGVSLVAAISRSWLSQDETALLALLAWALLVAAAYAWRRAKGGRLQALSRSLALLAFLALGAGLLSLASRELSQRVSPEAVIIQAEVAVSPQLAAAGTGEPAFYLHDGAEVLVDEQRGAWLHLTLPGGAVQGWVPQEAVEWIGLR